MAHTNSNQHQPPLCSSTLPPTRRARLCCLPHVLSHRHRSEADAAAQHYRRKQRETNKEGTAQSCAPLTAPLLCPLCIALVCAVSTPSLAGKVALITGASSGIGAAAARLFAKAGAKLVLNGRDEKRLNAVAAEIVAAGGQAVTLVGDVATEATNKALVDLALKTYGQLNIAFNNAASLATGGVSDVTAANLHALVDTNIKGLVFGLQFQLAAIAQSSSKDNWGVILNTSSSVSGRVKEGLEKFALYSVTKGAMDTLTKFTALEGGSRFVRVNSINTGAVKTPGATGVFGGAESYEQIIPNFILGGAAPQSPGELARFILFVADNQTGRFFNGANLVVDGGFSIK